MKRVDLIVFLLSAAAGSVDALSYLLFRVFTSAMSGNAVLLGIAIGQRALQPAVDSGIAFVGFGLGALIGTGLGGAQGDRVRAILGFEVLMLAGFAALGLANPAAHRPAPLGAAMIALAAVGMGAQAVAARRLHAPGIITVVFTSTLTAIAEALGRGLFKGKGGKPTETARQAAALACYAGGAVIGGVLAAHASGTIVPLGFALAALIVAVATKLGCHR